MHVTVYTTLQHKGGRKAIMPHIQVNISIKDTIIVILPSLRSNIINSQRNEYCSANAQDILPLQQSRTVFV